MDNWLAEEGIKDILENRYIKYKYKQVDWDTESIEYTERVKIKTIFFFFHKYITNKKYIYINLKASVNWTDIKEISNYSYGVDRKRKIIYWKYDGSKFY